MPEAGLHPDGTELIFRNANPRENTMEGPIPAILGDVFGIQLSPDELYAWYGRELEARGWVRDPLDTSSFRTTIEDSARVWRKGDVVARIAIFTKGDPQNPATSAADRFETVYEIALIAKAKESFAPMPT